MAHYSEKDDYREWLGQQVENVAGTLYGEGKGLWSLDTPSLEKLYMALTGQSPRRDYFHEEVG